MQANIKKLYLANFLAGVVFWYPIEKLFMQSIGISPVGIGVNAVVFLVITVLFDVPSGVLADKWKRKYTLALAMVCLGLSSFVLGSSHSLSMYLIGTALWAGNIVLTSGTFQAMMYDSLAEVDEQEHYDVHQGRSYGLFLTGIGVSSIAGGYISQYLGLRDAYMYSLIPAILNIVLLLSAHEPRFHKGTFDAKFWTHIKTSARVITSQPIAFHLAIFLVVAGMLRSTQNEFGGLYYIGLSLSTVAMGFANAGKWISGAIGQFLAPYVGRKRALAATPWFFVAFAIFSFITNASGVVFFFLAATLFSIVTNQSEAAMQNLVPSHVRATTLSLVSFCTNIIMIPLSLLFGWLTQTRGVFRGYQVFAVIGIGYVLFWLLRSRSVIRAN